MDINHAKEKLLTAKRPLFLFDNDPDGLASFLLLYRLVRCGKGIPLKSAIVDEEAVIRVHNYEPDLVLLLDKPAVDDRFFSQVKVPIIWIDHHEAQQVHRENVTYLNPNSTAEQANPTSYYCQQISQTDSWIAVVGCIADWQLPPQDLLEQFNTQHPSLALADNMTAQEILFETKIGELAQILSFSLKGKPTDVLSHLKILCRINDPLELLEERHAQARLVMKHYRQHKKAYETLKEEVVINEDAPLIVHTYTQKTNSYTTDLSNELLFRHPEKVILIARVSGGSYKCSLRSSTLPIDSILQATLTITGGQGGGHTHACGAIIPEEQFNDFVTIFTQKVMEAKEGLSVAA